MNKSVKIIALSSETKEIGKDSLKYIPYLFKLQNQLAMVIFDRFCDLLSFCYFFKNHWEIKNLCQ